MYKLLESGYRYDLQILVNKSMKEGWVPQGGVFLTSYGLRDTYLQAMVKYED